MYIYFGTVNRSSPVKKGGEIVKLNWDTKKIEKTVPVFPQNPNMENDPNPRGNTRGCRGISIYNGHILASNYHTLNFYDKDLNFQKAITHELMVGLHEQHYDGNGSIWLTSTAIDAALNYHIENGSLLKSYFPREMSFFQEKYDLQPLDFDKEIDQRSNFLAEQHIKESSHLHLNAVYAWNGDVYALFNRFGAIVNLTKQKIVLENTNLKGAHNLIINKDGILFSNNTRGGKVVGFDLKTNQVVFTLDLIKYLPIFKRVFWLEFKNRFLKSLKSLKIIEIPSKPLFVRGLGIKGDLIFVGFSPGTIACFNWKKEKLVDIYQYSKDVKVCIHGLAIGD